MLGLSPEIMTIRMSAAHLSAHIDGTLVTMCTQPVEVKVTILDKLAPLPFINPVLAEGD
jgi:hypothetical protein